MIIQDNNLVDELLKDANMTLLESLEDTLDQDEQEEYLDEVFEALAQALINAINRRKTK
jgi:hypothetical protein